MYVLCYTNLYTVNIVSLQAPEEFLDPVTNELMKEPVRLPTSGVTMDKSNVIRHLLRYYTSQIITKKHPLSNNLYCHACCSDSTDPFNRSPLTADMLEPNQLLKQRIEEWRKQKLAHLRKEQTDWFQMILIMRAYQICKVLFKKISHWNKKHLFRRDNVLPLHHIFCALLGKYETQLHTLYCVCSLTLYLWLSLAECDALIYFSLQAAPALRPNTSPAVCYIHKWKILCCEMKYTLTLTGRAPLLLDTLGNCSILRSMTRSFLCASKMYASDPGYDMTKL